MPNGRACIYEPQGSTWNKTIGTVCNPDIAWFESRCCMSTAIQCRHWPRVQSFDARGRRDVLRNPIEVVSSGEWTLALYIGKLCQPLPVWVSRGSVDLR